MSATELLMDLGRLGIRLEAEGGRLRYHPRSALTPDLLDQLKAHKGELLAMLQAKWIGASEFDVDSAPDTSPAPITEKPTHRMPQELRRRVEATVNTLPNTTPVRGTCCKPHHDPATWKYSSDQYRRPGWRTVSCNHCGVFIGYQPPQQ